MSLPRIERGQWLGGARRARDHAAEQATAGQRRAADAAGSAKRAIQAPLAGTSLRWRLTLAYSLMLLTMLSSFSLGIYWYVGTSRMDELVGQTEARAEQLRSDLDGLLRSTRQLQQIGDQLGGFGAFINAMIYRSQFVQEAFDPFVAPGTGLRIFDRRHNLVFPPAAGDQAMNAQMPGLPTRDQVMRTLPNKLAIIMALRGQKHREVVTGPEGDQVLAYTLPFYQSNPDTHMVEVVAAVQVLTSLKSYNETMEALRRILVLGTLLATALSALTGAALAQTAIAPIHRIARTAERINRAQDLGRRIEVDCPRDELGHLAVTINDMLERIASMFDRQRRFLADVSHELRTPLTTIRGEVELMQRTGTMDEEGLSAVSAESERMSRMIDDLLLLARADTEAMDDVEHAPVQLDALVLDVHQQAQMLARSYPEHQVRLDAVDAVVVEGDRDRLKQLLLNLAANALKHTPAGTTVSLGLRCEHDVARLYVSDDGPGIPADDVAHVFDRFYRVDKARARSGNHGGTGLGLSIVRSIARAHGGDVSLACPADGGTTFTVTLPVVPMQVQVDRDQVT